MGRPGPVTAAGIVLLAGAPWVIAAVGALDARVARVLLGPSRAEELEHRVEHLTQTRTGADPARGTGLAGLAKRGVSVDGTFEIASPPGGPTLITVDLPCAR